jgi:hypothetical protein
MLVIFNVALPVLLRVTLLAALVVVSLRAAKVSETGDSFAIGAAPVPESDTEGAVPAALLFTVSVAVRVPRAVGENVTLIVQDAFTASVLVPLGQLLVSVKSAGFVPLNRILVILSGAVPVLVNVIVCAVLEVPTS